jgi:tryptophan-rich sensory protein
MTLLYYHCTQRTTTSASGYLVLYAKKHSARQIARREERRGHHLHILFTFKSLTNHHSLNKESWHYKNRKRRQWKGIEHFIMQIPATIFMFFFLIVVVCRLVVLPVANAFSNLQLQRQQGNSHAPYKSFQPQRSQITRYTICGRITMGEQGSTITPPSIRYSGSTPKRSSSSSLNASLLSQVAWVATSAFGGMIGAPFVIQSTKTWYKNIPLPSYTPPNNIFAPVWTTLYTFMGIASWRIQSILQSSSKTNLVGNAPLFLSFLQKNIILLSLIHYAMNISWAPIFFGLKRLRAGHVLNVLLVITLLPIVTVYFSIDSLSGMLLLPYLAWLVLATKLSSGVCQLNPTEVKYGCWYNNAKLQDEIWKLRKEAAKKVGL